MVLSLKRVDRGTRRGRSRIHFGWIGEPDRVDRGTRKGESWIQPPGGSSGFQKELIAAPERVDRRFISVGSWNHIGWIVEPEKVKPGFTPLGVVPSLKKSGSRNQKRVVLSSRKGESWFHLFWNPDRFPFACNASLMLTLTLFAINARLFTGVQL